MSVILTERAQAAGLELLPLIPLLGDFNDDLQRDGVDGLGQRLITQLHDADRARFLRR